jgi:pyruvate/2-oxoglutarate/acetoin dehydrogenase E1 component
MTETLQYDDAGLLKVLVASEHARADALFRKNVRALESLLAPDYYEINLFGRFKRKDILTRILPLFTLHSFSIDDPHVQRTGKDIAVITYRCTVEATLGRNKKQGTFPVAARYMLIGNLWKISCWEIVSIPAT